jgi:hypothetical protein
LCKTFPWAILSMESQAEAANMLVSRITQEVSSNFLGVKRILSRSIVELVHWYILLATWDAICGRIVRFGERYCGPCTSGGRTRIHAVQKPVRRPLFE